MALTGNNAELYVKSGESLDKINPVTSATQVYMTDEGGVDSNVDAVIRSILQRISEIVGGGVAFKGVVTQDEPLPTVSYKAGWMYLVKEKGEYAGNTCEVGDIIICVKDYASGSASNADWSVVQKNIDGAVTGPDASSVGHVAVFNDTAGTQIKDSGFTIAKSVPADAKFTDTTYLPATAQADGLMSSADKTKLTGVEANADVTDAQNVAAAGAFMKDTNTADDIREGTTNKLFTAAERLKLSGIAENAEVNQNAVSFVSVNGTTISAGQSTDTLTITAGEGIALSADAGRKEITVAQAYVSSCVVTDLSQVPANLMDGGLVILKK